MAGGNFEPPVAFFAIFPLFFAGMWLFVTSLLGRLSGWHKLEEVYPDIELDPVRRRFRMQSASMGGAFGMPVNFNGILTIDVCPSGLRFSISRVLGLFRRPILVPWRDIAVDTRKVWFLSVARVRFARWEGGEMTMRIGRWNRIAAEAPALGLAITG